MTGQPESTAEIELPESLLAEIDTVWTERGYESRAAFLRATLWDAVDHPAFDRADLKVMLAGEVEIQNGETHTASEVKSESTQN